MGHRVRTASVEARCIIEVLKRIPRAPAKITSRKIVEMLKGTPYALRLRTAQRYLKMLTEQDFGVVCDDKSKPYGFSRVLKGSDLGLVGLDADGALLLLLAREHLRYQIPVTLKDSLGHLFNAAEEFMANSYGAEPGNQWLQNVQIVSSSLPMMPPLIVPRLFETVSKALYQRLKLDIEYEKTPGSLPEERRISPLGLVQQDARLYLVACYDDTTQIRTFALHRIRQAKITEFSAAAPKDFNLRRYLESEHFNFGKAPTVDLEIIFTSPQTYFNLLETPFNRSQKLEALPEGKFRLNVRIADSLPLKGWIEMWRERAGILSVNKTPVKE